MEELGVWEPAQIAQDDDAPVAERLDAARHELLNAYHSIHLKGTGYKAGMREKIGQAMELIDEASDTLMQVEVLF